MTSKRQKDNRNRTAAKMIAPSGVEDLMRVYERFQKAYAVTEQYLEITSPKTYQSNSNQSLILEKKSYANLG
jgi:hypothetical protein